MDNAYWWAEYGTQNKDWESDWDRFLDEINGGNDGGKA